MKTSINVPEWLYEQVSAACPEIPFGTLARDALIIALPVWGELGPERSVEQALRAQLRMMTATAGQAGVSLPGVKPAAAPAPRRRAAPTPPPAALPTRPKRAAPKSAPKAGGLSTPARGSRSELGRSRRRQEPTGGSSGAVASSPAAV